MTYDLVRPTRPGSYFPDLPERRRNDDFEKLKADPNRRLDMTRALPKQVNKNAIFWVGCDLGQLHDWTTLVVLARSGSPSVYEVVFMARTRATSYVDVVAAIKHMMARPELPSDQTEFVVDRSGVGVAVCDYLKKEGLDPIKATIHGGPKSTGTRRNFKVSKRDLVFNLLVLVDQKRLRVSPTLPLASALLDELETFSSGSSPSGRTTYNAAEGNHDDLISAVALSGWMAERYQRGETFMERLTLSQFNRSNDQGPYTESNLFDRVERYFNLR